jgi:hypothetical protein
VTPVAVEEWRPVVGYERDYEVSSQGRVRRLSGGQGATAGRLHKLTPNAGGYPHVTLWAGGRSKTHRVHRLVARAFLGEPPEGYAVNHRNGIKVDNRPENLEWVTWDENNRHALATGLKLRTGIKQWMARVAREDSEARR